MENFRRCREDKKLLFFENIASQIINADNVPDRGSVNEFSLSSQLRYLPHLEEVTDVFNIPEYFRAGYYQPTLYGFRKPGSYAGKYKFVQFISLPEEALQFLPKGSCLTYPQMKNFGLESELHHPIHVGYLKSFPSVLVITSDV